MKMKELWEYQCKDAIMGMTLGDINNNSQTELIAYSQSGKIYIFSLSGKLLLEEEISKGSSNWCGAIQDIDNDGVNELIFGGMDGLLRTFKCSEDYRLSSIWAHKLGTSISGILIDDLNNDEIDELIVYGLDNTMRVLNPESGELIWGQMFEKGIGSAITWEDTELGLSLKEVFAVGNDGTLRVFDGTNGEMKWFKKFSDKQRCVSYMDSDEGPVIICGGDDKQIHIIQKFSQEEIRTIKTKDYVWKSFSFPQTTHDKVIVSTYDFSFMESEEFIENIKFSSRLLCLDENLKTSWKVKHTNVESIRTIERPQENYILIGTTDGRIVIFDGEKGKEVQSINKGSCTNMVELRLENNLLFSCHDNGGIYAYFLDIF